MRTIDTTVATVGLICGLILLGVSKGHPSMFVACGELYVGSAVAYLVSRLTILK